MTFTGEDGQYQIAALDPGMYHVEEKDPRGYYSLSTNTLVVMVRANATAEANFADYPAPRLMVPLVVR